MFLNIRQSFLFGKLFFSSENRFINGKRLATQDGIDKQAKMIENSLEENF